MGHECNIVGETAWLWDCRRWPLALVCLSASGFGEAGLWDPPSESGVAFLVGACAHCVVCTSLSHAMAFWFKVGSYFKDEFFCLDFLSITFF